MTLRVVKSSSNSGTSHIVDGYAKDATLSTMCGVELKRSTSISIKQQGHVTCVPCITKWQHRDVSKAEAS